MGDTIEYALSQILCVIIAISLWNMLHVNLLTSNVSERVYYAET